MEVYINHVAGNRNLFLFMCQCRTGGTPALRNNIRNELKYFANELVLDVNQFRMLPDVDQGDLDMIAGLVINTVADITIDVGDEAPEKTSDRVHKIILAHTNGQT